VSEDSGMSLTYTKSLTLYTL